MRVIERPVVVLADDDAAIRRMIGDHLTEYQFEVHEARDGKEAKKIAQSLSSRIHLFLLDNMMPGISGVELLKELKADPALSPIPVLFLTGDGGEDRELEVLDAGAVDFIRKPASMRVIRNRVQRAINEYIHQLSMEEELVLSRDSMYRAQREIIHTLSAAVEFRDNDTGDHLQRMSNTAQLIAKALGMSDHKQELLYHAAVLHDVGKVAIPDAILLKPGRLTDDEMEVMKTHTTIGAKILSYGTSELLKYAETIALSHHERWDGGGYPLGLSGKDIPIGGRITAICDVYDALISERIYKKAWPKEEALALIKSESGKAFDPEVVEAFWGLLED